MKFRSLSLAIGLLLTSVTLTQAQQAAPKKPLGVSVIGASVSAGFGSGCDLAEILRVALGTDAEIADLANSTLFLDVTKGGRKQIDAASEKASDLVIGIDFLFWYAAGAKDLATRLADVDQAFSELDRLPGKTVIGTIPHMRHVSPLMLPASRQIPAAEVPEINAHIEKLAAVRERLRIITVDRWMDAIEDGIPADEFARIGVDSLDRNKLMLADGLHLNRDGMVLAAALLLDDLAGNELADRKPVRKLAELAARLAQNERNITIEVYDDQLESADAGLLRFELPSTAEMRAMGLGLDDLMKLRELRRYSKPLEFEGGNRVKITGLPAAAAKLKIRVRAERGVSSISRWAQVDLARVDSRVTLILRPVEELRVKVLGGEKALALPGVLVGIPQEIKGRGLHVDRLEGDGPGYATSDAEGLAVLRGIGPDASHIDLRLPDGRRASFAIDRSSSPQIVLVPESAPSEEAK